MRMDTYESEINAAQAALKLDMRAVCEMLQVK